MPNETYVNWNPNGLVNRGSIVKCSTDYITSINFKENTVHLQYMKADVPIDILGFGTIIVTAFNCWASKLPFSTIDGKIGVGKTNARMGVGDWVVSNSNLHVAGINMKEKKLYFDDIQSWLPWEYIGVQDFKISGNVWMTETEVQDVNEANNTIKVHDVWVSADPFLVKEMVQPDGEPDRQYSPLCTSTVPMPDKCNPRTSKITKITIHHTSGTADASSTALSHANSSRQASANYYVSDNQIVGGVDEYHRAWTSSSNWNDTQAITIETSNCAIGGDWPISQATYNNLVMLCAELCRHYGITPEFTGDTSASFTFHKMYAATDCPGPWIESHIQQIINDIKAQM